MKWVLKEMEDTFSENFQLVNNTNVTKGGPFTRCDLADTSKKSLLTLIIVSKGLFPYIETLKIDNDNKCAPMQVTKARKIMSDSDNEKYS